jgi:hypothetical protein
MENGTTTTPVCFVCFESDPQGMICACKDLRCHVECQRKLLEMQDEPVCRVCDSPYTNVFLRPTAHLTAVGMSVMLTSCTFIFMFAPLFVLYAKETWLFLVETVALVIVFGWVLVNMMRSNNLAEVTTAMIVFEAH